MRDFTLTESELCNWRPINQPWGGIMSIFIVDGMTVCWNNICQHFAFLAPVTLKILSLLDLDSALERVEVFTANANCVADEMESNI